MAFANDKPVNHVTWPAGAITGHTRMVVGADTPPELVLYGIQVAMLFYVVDVPTNKEVGYFFIALSNMLDFQATANVCLFGEVVYPIPGNPNSPGFDDVNTHFQMTMNDTNTFLTDLASTRFKDFCAIFESTVLEVQFKGTRVRLMNGTFFVETGTSMLIEDGGTFAYKTPAGLLLEPARGLCTELSITTSGASVGTTESLNYTLPVYTYQAGRAYRVVLQSALTASVAGVVAFQRLMKGSTVVIANSLGEFGRTYVGSASTSGGWFYGMKEFVCGPNDVTTALCISIQCGTGTASPGTVASYANVNSPRTATVEDIGWAYQVASGLPVLT